MRRLFRIFFVIGLALAALGIFEYTHESALHDNTAHAFARIQDVQDKPIIITTEGRLNGPHEYVDHACHYTITFSSTNDDHTNITTHLDTYGKLCANTSDHILISYDRLSPGNTVHTYNGEPIIPAGGFELLFGIILITASYYDLRKLKKRLDENE